ncbi:P-loop NTPase family protein [Sessilibacter sp. MAH2]
MARVHFISGEKGGVGKSFTARTLAQYFIDAEQPFIGFDSDQSHSTFSRFYAEFTSPVVIDDFESMDEILVAAEENGRAEIIVDLAAQTADSLEDWIDESDLFAILEAIDAKAYFWHVMDDGADSARLLDRFIKKYQDLPMQMVIVKNMGRGANFDLFDKSAIFERAQSINAIFVTLPKLQSQLAQKIDFYNFSFWAAANNAKAMSTAERQRVKVWLNNCYSKFDRFLKVEKKA